ncbi:MAG TPA: molecular chaperone DnaJ, partial [Paludibacter sp.]|nr:molecular chaperone DnaJ [Paludibacter sp.]
MAGFGKWIGGGLGWAFGGPIGALIGFAVGSMFDTPGNVVMNQQTTVRSRQTTETDFKMSLLVMMACILKAD